MNASQGGWTFRPRHSTAPFAAESGVAGGSWWAAGWRSTQTRVVHQPPSYAACRLVTLLGARGRRALDGFNPCALRLVSLFGLDGLSQKGVFRLFVSSRSRRLSVRVRRLWQHRSPNNWLFSLTPTERPLEEGAVQPALLRVLRVAPIFLVFSFLVCWVGLLVHVRRDARPQHLDRQGS